MKSPFLGLPYSLLFCCVLLCQPLAAYAAPINEKVIVEGIAEWAVETAAKQFVENELRRILDQPYMGKYFPYTSERIKSRDIATKSYVTLLSDYVKLDMQRLDTVLKECIPDRLKDYRQEIRRIRDWLKQFDKQRVKSLLQGSEQAVLEQSAELSQELLHFLKSVQKIADFKQTHYTVNDLHQDLACGDAPTTPTLAADQLDPAEGPAPATRAPIKLMPLLVQEKGLLDTNYAAKQAAAYEQPSLLTLVESKEAAASNRLGNNIELFKKVLGQLEETAAFLNALKKEEISYTLALNEFNNMIKAIAPDSRIIDFLEYQDIALLLAQLADAGSLKSESPSADAEQRGKAMVKAALNTFSDLGTSERNKDKPTGIWNWYRDEMTGINWSADCWRCKNKLSLEVHVGAVWSPNHQKPFSPFLPIGLEYKILTHYDKVLSLNYSPLDLGNVARNLYHDKNAQGQAQDPTFDDVVSNSVFFSLNWKRSGFGLIAGYQDGVKTVDDSEVEGVIIGLTYNFTPITLW